VRVPECSDSIEPLLIGHDEQDIGQAHNVILSEAKNLGSILEGSSRQNIPEMFRSVQHDGAVYEDE